MKNCIFCKIIDKKIPSKTLLEKEETIVFQDIEPKAPIHYLVIPKKHIASLNEVKKEEKELLGELMLTAREAAEKLGIKDDGYKLAVHTGEGGGQEVFHLHVHLMGGWKNKV